MDQQTWADWFDRVNGAALTWYGVYQAGQTGDQRIVVSQTPTTLGASISPALLIVAGVVILGAIYVAKK